MNTILDALDLVLEGHSVDEIIDLLLEMNIIRGADMWHHTFEPKKVSRAVKAAKKVSRGLNVGYVAGASKVKPGKLKKLAGFFSSHTK